MWKQLHRIIKKIGAIVLFGSEPFSSALRMSNIKNYKYDWVWEKDKSKCNNFVHANNSPLRQTENIIVFSFGRIAHKGKNKNRMEYNPQGLIRVDKKVKGNNKGGKNNEHTIERPSNKKEYIRKFTNYPTNILKFNTDLKKQAHPTQKPVELGRYLVRTYTNPGEVILDFTAGSGSFGVSAVLEGRGFIGIEKEKKYCDIMVDRLKKAQEEVASRLF